MKVFCTCVDKAGFWVKRYKFIFLPSLVLICAFAYPVWIGNCQLGFTIKPLSWVEWLRTIEELIRLFLHCRCHQWPLPRLTGRLANWVVLLRGKLIVLHLPDLFLCFKVDDCIQLPMDVDIGFIFPRLGVDMLWLGSFNGVRLVYVEHWVFGAHLDSLQSILINLYISKCNFPSLLLFSLFQFHFKTFRRPSLPIPTRIPFVIFERAPSWISNRTFDWFKNSWLLMPIVINWMNWVYWMTCIHSHRFDWLLTCNWTLFQWAFICNCSNWNRSK